MKHIDLQPVVMAGGSGTRLWPLSRAQYPKQFLVLNDNRSLFQQAAQRLAGLAASDIAVAPLCVVGNEEHRFLVLEQLRELGDSGATLLLEPMGRNTAPAMTLAALHAMQAGRDPVLVVTPADQTVVDEPAFTTALQRAARLASEGPIVILGVQPDRPETGYGYINASGNETSGMRVERFVEKPDLATAQRYLADGHYFWNSGMFVVRASVWMAAIERFRGDIAAATRLAWEERQTDAAFVRPGREQFAAIPSESIDYAVMEPVSAAPGSFSLRMVPLAAGWNDLGAWEAVWQVSPKDEAGNATRGDTLLRDSRNTLVHATSRLVGVVGMDNVVVIETPDAVLVAERSRSQEVKQIVAELDRAGRSEQTLHRQVHRPWGWYDSIDAGGRFQVKRIMVKPGAALSLQMHHHRAEHWIVVSGTAEVTCGERKILLSENQSTYIPLGEKHRLANPGKVPLEIIEVQSGSYLGEDDIVRFEDTYGRAK
ncbi:mannose-1-phosphate guanylyltransferase/mannose-6-phosphate isomerase [uncultured Piscinibacter sp.]|uniref:mannose-1-phosphate guanylyltransferase/mannose-6-phosphate isomerase n=1 Tax=uncultured Piscinibacter sp. TaxID=1131835 RepID=UPI00263329D0|nr:mannose-1-phosphate guanylyltransferase/mannose-6-phosphate isomerase [uncultured Piscinibacter sp.]